MASSVAFARPESYEEFRSLLRAALLRLPAGTLLIRVLLGPDALVFLSRLAADPRAKMMQRFMGADPIGYAVRTGGENPGSFFWRSVDQAGFWVLHFQALLSSTDEQILQDCWPGSSATEWRKVRTTINHLSAMLPVATRQRWQVSRFF